MGTTRAVIKTLRPRQWVKNAFVLAPLVFAQRLLDPQAVALACLGFACFCGLSGAVYALNDLLDRHADREHPTKRFRPIASGELSPRGALILSATLALGALGTAFAMTPWLGVVAVTYLSVNLGYSLGLKHIAYLDVILIASGFMLRVLAGAFVIDVPASGWLLLCTGLLASFLGLGKRLHEIRAVAAKGNATRASLRAYKVGVVRVLLRVLAVATIGAFGAYTQAAHTVEMFGTRALLASVPFCAFGLLRYLALTDQADRPESPSDAMLRDRVFLANLAVWTIAVGLILYAR